MTGCTTEEISLYGKDIFLSKMSRLAVGPTQPPVEWVTGVTWLGWSWPFHLEGQVYEYVAVYPHSSPLHDIYRVTCTLTFCVWQQNKINKLFATAANIVCKPSNCKHNMPWSSPCWIILVVRLSLLPFHFPLCSFTKQILYSINFWT